MEFMEPLYTEGPDPMHKHINSELDMLLRPLGKKVLVEVIKQMQHQFNTSEGAVEELTGIIRRAETLQVLAEQQQQQTDFSSFSAAMGLHPLRLLGGAPEFRARNPAGRKHPARAGLLKVGSVPLRRVWELLLPGGHRKQRTWKAGKPVRDQQPHCCFLPGGDLVLSCLGVGVELWDASSKSQALMPALHGVLGKKKNIFFCCFAPDGKSMLSASADASLKVWGDTSCFPNDHHADNK